MWAILPPGRPCVDFSLVAYELSSPGRVESIEPTYRFEMADGSLFGWTIVAPHANQVCECRWTWNKYRRSIGPRHRKILFFSLATVNRQSRRDRIDHSLPGFGLPKRNSSPICCIETGEPEKVVNVRFVALREQSCGRSIRCSRQQP